MSRTTVTDVRELIEEINEKSHTELDFSNNHSGYRLMEAESARWIGPRHDGGGEMYNFLMGFQHGMGYSP